jgi:hypothetical protein
MTEDEITDRLAVKHCDCSTAAKLLGRGITEHMPHREEQVKANQQ